MHGDLECTLKEAMFGARKTGIVYVAQADFVERSLAPDQLAETRECAIQLHRAK